MVVVESFLLQEMPFSSYQNLSRCSTMVAKEVLICKRKETQ